eukprot:3449020-Pyramimonas_sp.AAC.1
MPTLNACRLKPKAGSTLIDILALVKDGVTLKTRAKLVPMWRVKDGQFLPFGAALVNVRGLVVPQGTPSELST